MKLTQEQKDRITTEYEQWKEKMYAGKSKEERQKMGQFFTPPELSIKMIEKFDSLDTYWLDPTIGAGNLIAAVIMAGADPTICYGNELDPDILEICRQRLEPLGVPHNHLHQGNALYSECVVLESFTDDYDWKTLEPIAIANAAKKVKAARTAELVKEVKARQAAEKAAALKAKIAKAEKAMEKAIAKAEAEAEKAEAEAKVK